MAEHIVARALRAEADDIRSQADAEQDYKMRSIMSWVADEFTAVAARLGTMEAQPLATWHDVGVTEGGVQLAAPVCTRNDACRVAGHPRGNHTPGGVPADVQERIQPTRFSPQSHGPDLPEGAHPDSPGARELYEPLRIIKPVGISGFGGNSVHVVGGTGGAGPVSMAGGGGGGSSWMPEIRIGVQRIELAAKAAYQQMTAHAARATTPHTDTLRPALWEHLDERDKASWREAARQVLVAALSPEWTS